MKIIKDVKRLVEHGKVVFERIVPGAHGLAFLVKKGQTLRISDVEGGQIVDFVCFNEKNPKEKLSTCRSMSLNMLRVGDARLKGKFGEGDILYSNVFNPMFTIVENTCGASDIFYCQCNRILWGMIKAPTGASTGKYDGCFEIMTDALKDWGLTKYDVPCPFNINMKTEQDSETGFFYAKPSTSKPGDYIELRAEMDCLVTASACPYKPVQEGSELKLRSTPIKIEVVET